MTTKLSFLAPWLTLLKSCISISNTVVTVQVYDYLHPVPRDISPATFEQLRRLREALDLFYVAINTASSSDQKRLLKMYQLPESTHSISAIALAFQAGPCGDVHTALNLLQALLDPLDHIELSDAFQAAHAVLIERANRDGVLRNLCPTYSIRLKPPIKVGLNPISIALITPSRADTIAYYTDVLSTLETVSQREREVNIGTIKLDLGHLITPPEALQTLRQILALPLCITALMIKVGVDWSDSDRECFVKALNQRRSYSVKLLKLQILDTKSGDNFIGALPYISVLRGIQCIELEQIYESLLPGSISARVPSSAHTRVSKKPAQQVATTNEANIQHTLSSTSRLSPSRPTSLTVSLSGRNVRAFLRELPHLGSELRSLEIFVSDINNCVVHLGSIARECPRLRSLNVHGSDVVGVDDLCDWIERGEAEIMSIILYDVVVYDREPLKLLARRLSDPRSVLARKLQVLEFVQREPLASDEITNFELVLKLNKRLELLTLGGVAALTTALLRFDSEPLHSLKYAFLSSVSSRIGSNSAMSRLDMWCASEIMQFAGLSRHRHVRVISTNH